MLPPASTALTKLEVDKDAWVMPHIPSFYKASWHHLPFVLTAPIGLHSTMRPAAAPASPSTLWDAAHTPPCSPMGEPPGRPCHLHATLPAMQAGTWQLPYSWEWPAASPHPSLALWLLLSRVTLAPGGRKVRALRLHQHVEEHGSALCTACPGMGSGGERGTLHP